MKYYLVGDVGVNALVTGKSTVIRKRRTPAGGFEWSYLYRVGLEDAAWQREQAPEPADAEKRLFWGGWKDWDMVEAGAYASIQGISEAQVRALIQVADPCPFCGRGIRQAAE